jgi:hypothetical protein
MSRRSFLNFQISPLLLHLLHFNLGSAESNQRTLHFSTTFNNSWIFNQELLQDRVSEKQVFLDI